MAETLHFPASEASKLEKHLPAQVDKNNPEMPDRPFLTLTFATSMDSSLSLAPGVRTTLSGPQSKAMTHYLRSRHDAILIGVNTAIADDPALNCRIEGATQPYPIILDPHARWAFTAESKVMKVAAEGRGRAPFIVTCVPGRIPKERVKLLTSLGGKYIYLEGKHSEVVEGQPWKRRATWNHVLQALRLEGLTSVMVEGGGSIINSLLEWPNNELVDSVIVTIAPTWLGQGGVVVSPARVTDEQGNPVAALRLKDVEWLPLGEDVVMCGKVKR